MLLVVFLYEGYVTVMLKQSMQKLTSLVLIVVLILLAFKSYAESVSSADFILINGEFYTVNEQQPWAQAVAIKDGIIFKFIIM